MKLLAFCFTVSIHCAFLIKASRSLIDAIGVNVKPSKTFCQSVESVCKDNADNPIVLLLDMKKDFEVQYYLINCTKNDLCTITNQKLHFLYNKADSSNTTFLMSKLRTQNTLKNIAPHSEDVGELEKKMLYIIFQSEIETVIVKQSNSLIKDQDKDHYQYNTALNYVYDEPEINEMMKKPFEIKFRMFQYVCDILKDKLPELIKARRESGHHISFENIQKNLLRVLALFDNNGTKESGKDNVPELSLFLPFLKHVFKGDNAPKGEEQLFNALKLYAFANKTARILNNLRIVVEDNNVQLRDGFLEHVLNCVSYYLVNKY